MVRAMNAPGQPELASFPDHTTVHEVTLPDGLHMRYYARGPEDGPTALFVHGFPELAVSWRFQFAALSERVRCVAPDMRGYGGTDAPPARLDYTVDKLSDDLAGLIDHLGGPVHLVGHDWGGAVCWAAAGPLGDRLHTLSVLNCPPAHMLQRALVTNPRQFLRSWYMLFFQLPWLPEWFMCRDPAKTVDGVFRGTAYNKTPFTDDDLAPYVRQLSERGIPGVNYYRANRWPPPPPPAPIGVPTRLIWGLQDSALGPWFATSEAYFSFAPEFDRVLLDAAGHWVQAEAADQVNQALQEHWAKVTSGI